MSQGVAPSVWDRIRSVMSDMDRRSGPGREEQQKALHEKWRRLAAELAKPPEEERENLLWEKVLLLKVGHERYAFRLDDVEEIMRVPGITPLPCVPAHFIGVVNRRGAILPVVDLKVLFGGQRGHETRDSRLVVLSRGRLNLSLLVEGAERIVGLAPECIQPAPRRGTGVQEEFAEGMITFAKKVVVILDTGRLLKDERMKVDQGA